MAKAKDLLLTTARGELGYLEKKSNSYLDDKTANAGSANYTKYWRDMLPEFQGKPWCDAFVSWCFLKTFGKETAQKLLCGGLYSYYTPTSAECFQNKGQYYRSAPKSGDVVYFNVGGKIGHTGIVESVNGTTITTIEGNTSGASGVVQNGGGVCRKYYNNCNNNSYINGYGRPDYSIAEVDDMTEQDVRNIVANMLAGWGDTPSDWAVNNGSWKRAKTAGIVDGSRPKGYAKREEVAAMILAALEDDGK